MKLLVLFVILSCSTTYSKEVVDIPFYYKSNPPLIIIDDHSYVGGIYLDSVNAILNLAGIKFKLTPLPKTRARQNFWEGKSELSCCENPSWRKFPKEMEVQLFSEPFLELRDVIVVRDNFKKNLSEIDKIHFALQRGYTYKDDSKFFGKTYLPSADTMLEFVSLGRAEAAIVSEFSYLDYIKRHKVKLKIGKVFSVDSIHFRVHKNSKDLLVRINKAIKELKKKGSFNKIIQQNTK